MGSVNALTCQCKKDPGVIFLATLLLNQMLQIHMCRSVGKVVYAQKLNWCCFKMCYHCVDVRYLTLVICLAAYSVWRSLEPLTSVNH